MRSSDAKTRDLVTTRPGQGWDYGQTRHPYHMIERPKGPHYCLYNRRHMAVCFDDDLHRHHRGRRRMLRRGRSTSS